MMADECLEMLAKLKYGIEDNGPKDITPMA